MVDEAGGCWRVVGLDDGVFDGVVEVGDRFCLVPDPETPVAGREGCCDESTDRDGVGYWPVRVGDVDAVVVGDMSDERDTPVTDGEVEGAFRVEMVGNGDVGRPPQLVCVGLDVLGRVAGPDHIGVVDRAAGDS